MIFSSYAYLIFLACVVVAFRFLEVRLPGLRRTFLLIASFIFYAWWRADFLLLLLGSTIANFTIGSAITRSCEKRRSPRMLLLTGLVFNLGLIAWFKYAGFFATTANGLFGAHLAVPNLFLPLAISFFTFEQISYLVDASQGHAPRYSLLDYSLFVSFFPHLIAGPIIRHNDLIPQFSKDRAPDERDDDLAHGVTLFTIGLAKKALIADNLAPFSDAIFAAAQRGTSIGVVDAWMGTLFFAFQIYFDFSAYSDMALGSAAMLGIRLPINFNSPYKAASIIDFWRRWHISLSMFLRDYLYIPLGGNRHGTAQRYANILITMFLGGLWHGANWTFVIWGGLHGIYLVINHIWRHLTKTFAVSIPSGLRAVTHGLSVLVTFLSVVFAWTIFRADNFGTAARMIAGLSGLGGHSKLLTFGAPAAAAFAVLFALVWLAPNSMEITGRLQSAPELQPNDARPRYFGNIQWRPTPAGAMTFALLFVVSVLALSNLSPFIYFQF